MVLHGLLGARLQMDPLARALVAEGYTVRNLGHASTRFSLDAIAERLASEFAAGVNGPLHFVTHSMGSLVARALVSRRRPANLGRMVMLAPSNNGSEIADRLWCSRGPTPPSSGTAA